MHEPSTSSALACPVCMAPFAADGRAAYNLHVRVCSSSSSHAPTSVPTLFSAQCALCGAGGRSLLHCGGSCARVFHAACVDEVQPTNNNRASGGSSLVAHWTCAECARGVHACQLCGFLGHESSTMVKCALVDCGFFFHASCLPAAPDQQEEALICPRHRCSKCGLEERDMRKCVSCTRCFAAHHLQCPAAHVSSSSSSTSLSPDTQYLHICEAHASSTRRPEAADETRALKYRVQQGDLVLLLEFANAILPQSAKDAAPEACNQWGVVTRAESLDGPRNQLLSISIFSDGSVIVVPNRYVLSLGSANAFATPQAMLRDCIKWHAVTELNLRHKVLDAVAATREENIKQQETLARILETSCLAFNARAEELALSPVKVRAAVDDGYAFWRMHRAELEKFEGSGAPIYVFMDTRSLASESDEVALEDGSLVSAGDLVSASTTRAHDVVMEEGETRDAALYGTEDSGDVVESPGAEKNIAASFDVGGAVSSFAELVSSESSVAQPSERKADTASPAPVAPVVCQENADLTASTADAVSERQHIVEGQEQTRAASDVSARKESVSVSASLEATLVAPLSSENGTQQQDGRGETSSELHDAKRHKLSHDQQPQPQTVASFAVSAAQSIRPLLSASNTFARDKENYTASQTVMKQTHTRRERVLAEYTPQMLQELEHQAAEFLEDEANPARRRRSRKSPNPKHSDAFPSATSSESFRPPFFRPSVVFSRARGRRMEGLSRILLSQDKRNIKCFIQGTDENRCLHQPPSLAVSSSNGSVQAQLPRAQGSFVTIDLMSVDSFRALEMAIRTRMIAAVEQNDGYLQEIFEVNADRARQLFAEKKRSGLVMELFYCSYDGSREKVARDKDDWLCFCANVCHLTAVIPLQALDGNRAED